MLCIMFACSFVSKHDYAKNHSVDFHIIQRKDGTCMGQGRKDYILVLIPIWIQEFLKNFTIAYGMGSSLWVRQQSDNTRRLAASHIERMNGCLGGGWRSPSASGLVVDAA